MHKNTKPIIYIIVGFLFTLSILVDYFLVNYFLGADPLLATYVLWPATLLALVFIFQATVKLLEKNPVSTILFRDDSYVAYFFSPLAVIPIIAILGYIYFLYEAPGAGFGALMIPLLAAMICVGYLSIYFSIKLFFSGTVTRHTIFTVFTIVTILYSIAVGMNIIDNVKRIYNHETQIVNYQTQIQKLKELPLGSNSSHWNTLWLSPHKLTKDMIIRDALYNLITFNRYELFNELAKCGDPSLFYLYKDINSIFIDDKLVYTYVYGSGISTYDENVIRIDHLKGKIVICDQTYPISYFSEILDPSQSSLKIKLYPEEDTYDTQISENIELNTRFQEHRKKIEEEWDRLYKN